MFPSILTFDFDLILGLFWLFWALLGYFWVQCGAQKLSLGPFVQLSNFHFLWFPEFWRLNLTLFYGHFVFWGTNGLFLSLIWVSKTVLGSTHVVYQLSFLWFPEFWNLNLTEFWGHFCLFGALMGWFGGRSRVQQLFWDLLM